MGRAATLKLARRTAPDLKLDLGCGQVPREGFTGVDLYGDPAIKCDLLKFPWPWAANSVAEVHSSHFLEHVPGHLRPKLIEELYRVLKVGAQATIVVPYWSSMRAVQDYTHQWPPICEASFLYFNKDWRAANKLTHGLYALTCDFDFTYGYHGIPAQELTGRGEDFMRFASAHYVNVIADLQVVLTKRG